MTESVETENTNRARLAQRSLNYLGERTYAGKYLAIFAVVWTLIMGAMLGWVFHEHDKTVYRVALERARISFAKDVSFRKWNATRGGVYAPISEVNKPNDILEDLVHNRDVTTDDGQRLTLINPAYMMRQLWDESGKAHEIAGHITSLDPVSKSNTPDEWERKALQEIEAGADEFSEVVEIGGEPYLRLMSPLTMDESCMKCHRELGLEVGELRGGITEAVKLAPITGAVYDDGFSEVIAGFLTWAAGLLALAVFWRMLKSTHLRRLEYERGLIRARNELEATNRDLEQFAYAVAHDLKSPMVAIDNISTWLHDDIADQLDDEHKEMLDLLTVRARRMIEMIDDILDYSVVGTKYGDPEELDLNVTVEQILAMLDIPENFNVNLPVPLPTVWSSKSTVQRVFMNLINNALKHSGGDTLSIEFEPDEDRRFHRFCVRDNGVGIDPQFHDEVFEFMNKLETRDKVQGNGIGLTMVRKIVKTYGGSIWIESEPGKGAAFYFTWPRGAEHLDKSEAPRE